MAETCTCAPLFDDCQYGVGETCPGLALSSCSTLLEFRQAPQTLGPATCGDLDACGNVVVGPDGCLLPIEQAPVTECDYQVSTAVGLQRSVDHARRQIHLMGFRPYRVFLVWQRRDRKQQFVEFRRQELMPVRVSPLNDVDLELQAIGIDTNGGIRLTRVSPNQVDEWTLRGLIDRKPLGNGEEFFYEVVRQPRFPGDLPERARFTVSATPYLNGSKFQWEVELISQENERGRQGEDQTHEPKGARAKRRLEVLRR